MMRETGVKMQCICPAFADTDIMKVDNPNKEFEGKNYSLKGVKESKWIKQWPINRC